VLTVEGRALLGEARAIGEGVDKLRAKVKNMLEGLEAEVNIALDVMLLPTRTKAILRAFYNTFPTVSLRIHVEAPDVVAALVQDKVAVVGVSGPVAAGVGGLHSVGAGALAIVPVAAPDHPLARMNRIALGEGRCHTQLVLADRSRLTERHDFPVSSTRVWSLEDLGTKHLLLKEGVGWGNMPLPLIESDLATGALVRLRMPDHPASMYRFSGVWRHDFPPGPAARWLLDQFASDTGEPGLSSI
jgi:DNA-binding transcriptional LysR family regulator